MDENKILDEIINQLSEIMLNFREKHFIEITKRLLYDNEYDITSTNTTHTRNHKQIDLVSLLMASINSMRNANLTLKEKNLPFRLGSDPIEVTLQVYITDCTLDDIIKLELAV